MKIALKLPGNPDENYISRIKDQINYMRSQSQDQMQDLIWDQYAQMLDLYDLHFDAHIKERGDEQHLDCKAKQADILDKLEELEELEKFMKEEEQRYRQK